MLVQLLQALASHTAESCSSMIASTAILWPMMQIARIVHLSQPYAGVRNIKEQVQSTTCSHSCLEACFSQADLHTACLIVPHSSASLLADPCDCSMVRTALLMGLSKLICIANFAGLQPPQQCTSNALDCTLHCLSVVIAMQNVHINNLVAQVDVGFPVNLKQLERDHPYFATVSWVLQLASHVSHSVLYRAEQQGIRVDGLAVHGNDCTVHCTWHCLCNHGSTTSVPVCVKTLAASEW